MTERTIEYNYVVFVAGKPATGVEHRSIDEARKESGRLLTEGASRVQIRGTYTETEETTR